MMRVIFLILSVNVMVLREKQLGPHDDAII